MAWAVATPVTWGQAVALCKLPAHEAGGEIEGSRDACARAVRAASASAYASDSVRSPASESAKSVQSDVDEYVRARRGRPESDELPTLEAA